MHKWNGMLYASLLVQMVSSSGFDYGLASTSGLDLGATGIAYSSIASSIIVFAINLFVIWYKLGFSIEGMTEKIHSPFSLNHINNVLLLVSEDMKTGWNFNWLKTWSQIGFYSGLESFIKNAVYLVVVLRAMNLLNEQGSYWVANTFIWSWLLLPILPLADLIKQVCKDI